MTGSGLPTAPRLRQTHHGPRRGSRMMLTATAVLGLLTAGSTLSAQAQDAGICGTQDGTGCAPPESRVDLAPPIFSQPTAFTNALHPSGNLRSGVMLGLSAGRPFRVEITLLPGHKVIKLDGVAVPALESQYVAFLDGQVHEVALDWYAQADDGSVWYLGEDVFNYEDGVVADTEGTWQAGRDAPPAMIMPAQPQVGDVYRPENAPGVVFEEVVVTKTGLEVAGPRGPVQGAIEVDELHMDGSHELKLFAPGYGEFSTGSGPDLEALALAVPSDALSGPLPAELPIISQQTTVIGEAAAAGDWAAAGAALDALRSSWDAYQVGAVPPLLETAMVDAIGALAAAVDANEPLPARTAAIAVARLGLDLELRHRDHAGVDIDRFALWLEQLAVDTIVGDEAAVLRDITAMEWTRDRFAEALDEADIAAIGASLVRMRAAVERGDLAAAGEAAAEIRQLIAMLPTIPQLSASAERLERETGFEPATSSLEGWRSTN